MDRFEDRCWLDWWANSLPLLLDSVEVVVVITAATGGWEANGHLVSDSGSKDPRGVCIPVRTRYPSSRCDSKTRALSPSPFIPRMGIAASASPSRPVRPSDR